MKILFYGNCQVQVAMHALAARNPKIECEYAGNSRRVTKYDPDRTADLMDWCDHIITQPVMNLENPDHHDVLRARFAGRITFMPYLWVDGLYSLCAAPGAKAAQGKAAASKLAAGKVAAGKSVRAGIIGEDIISAEIERVGLALTLANFRSGEIDFQHRQRLDDSLAELEWREESADVRVAPMVRALYPDQVVMLTHNHPHPDVVNEIARQIADRLSLTYTPITPQEHLRYATITLPEFGKVLSPYTVADLGLRQPYDLHWLKTGRELITDIARAMGALSAKKD